MSENVSCACGYRGPAVVEAGSSVCPICRTPAAVVGESTAYHIPCPNGHVVKAREEWLGREMVCPKCSAAFVLQATQSLEYQQELQRRQDIADEKQATIWITRAIVAGVLVVLSFVAMVVASVNPQWFQPKP
jgi:uncharacterized protein YbaR (Trm112 family)